MAARTRRHLPLGAGIVVFAAVFVAVIWAREPVADGVTRSFAVSGSSIALTFDDGPDPAYTPAVLDVLAEHDAHATFFVVGESAAEYPELVARILAEGHEVAFHSHTHSQVDRLGKREVHAEMHYGLTLLHERGVEPLWYRPPRGKLTAAQSELASEHGMKVALWSRCMERVRFTSAGEMASTLAEETRVGDVILAHDGLGDRSMTVEALPQYLHAIRQRDIEVVTLSRLEGLAPPPIADLTRTAARCDCARPAARP